MASSPVISTARGGWALEGTLALFLLSVLATGCSGMAPPRAGGDLSPPGSYAVTTPSDLQYTDVTQGSGPEAAAGKLVSINYTAMTEDGSTIDSSRNRHVPLTFVLGRAQTIAGLDEGVTGMRVGGERWLHIPANLGYGSQGGGPVPPDTPLVFEVQLISVQ